MTNLNGRKDEIAKQHYIQKVMQVFFFPSYTKSNTPRPVGKNKEVISSPLKSSIHFRPFKRMWTKQLIDQLEGNNNKRTSDGVTFLSNILHHTVSFMGNSFVLNERMEKDIVRRGRNVRPK